VAEEPVRMPLGLGILVGAVVVGAATLVPWRSGPGIEGIAGLLALVLAIALGLLGAFAIRDPSFRGNWLGAFALATVVIIVAVGYATTDAGLVPAPCDDIASCAYLAMVPAGVGLGLIAAIVGGLIVGSVALVGARRHLTTIGGDPWGN
jgi:hypothetical protein